MATNRSQRLRKKLCVDEFQELGFELNLDFKEDLSEAAIDAFLDAFLKEAMEANGLGYVGGDDYGLVCLQKRGSVSDEQRAAVEAWLKTRSELTKYEVSPLLDVWYPEKPINATSDGRKNGDLRVAVFFRLGFGCLGVWLGIVVNLPLIGTPPAQPSPLEREPTCGLFKSLSSTRYPISAYVFQTPRSVPSPSGRGLRG